MKSLLRWMLVGMGIAILPLATLEAGQMQQVNPGVARETAECFPGAGQRVDCFARTFGNGLSAVFADSETWNLPRNLGGNLAAAPSCISRGTGSISCFAASDSGVLATITLDGTVWSRWSSLGGALAPSRVSCVPLGKKMISCHARGAEGHFLERTRDEDGVWGKWRSFGPVFSADPACLAIQGNRDACFGRGAQGGFVALIPAGDEAGPQAIRFEGNVEGRPSCVSDQAGSITCVMLDAAGGFAMWRGQASAGSVGSGLRRIEVPAAGEPSCFARSGGVVCGWRNERSELSVAQISSEGTVAPIQISPTGRISGVKCLSLASGTSACIATGADKSLRYVSLTTSSRPVQEKAPAPATTVEMPVAKPGLEGTWNLTDVSTGKSCSISLQEAGEARPGQLRLSQACHALALPQGLSQWKREIGSLRFCGTDSAHALHFTRVEEGRWISPMPSSALMLSRQDIVRSQEARAGRDRTRARASHRGRGRTHR